MIIITNVYHPTHETRIMRESFERQGYEVASINAKGNGLVLKELLKCYKRAITGHEMFIYSDGADTFLQKKLTKKQENLLENKIVYSTEKNCWPLSHLASEYPESDSYWKYLNGGGYGGPLALIIEFFEKYKLDKHPAMANGQLQQAEAFLQAKKDGFPIELDYKCELFQTTAFDAMNHDDQDKKDSSFTITKTGLIRNKVTKTTPAILHANGRSPLEWIWDNHEWTQEFRN